MYNKYKETKNIHKTFSRRIFQYLFHCDSSFCYIFLYCKENNFGCLYRPTYLFLKKQHGRNVVSNSKMDK